MDTTGIAWRTMAFVACVMGAGAAQAQAAYPPPSIDISVAVGQKVAIWVQPNYSVLCRSLGQPTFQLDSKPTLGEVLPEWIDYTVPDGQRCETMRFPGMIVWYQAGQTPGTDVVVWTVGFPREFTSRVPGTGDHRVTTTVVVQ
ncbi:hypothetical protein PI93_008675 [Pandoraea fibrosis]|uniref:Lipoprotein n=1 Tax=Pandoraea fibrosis TaxID=1891094 RepID=A0ABX6HQ41_9BURK|nr:hypothetical protein [Pandoraea fibrosis]QHE93731.1 hypothetical protein PJ20_019320 [Pandoraea fibrosis]QHF12707.1 hypothetical protein PI93_008675 [Pandoraea fibrosis]